MRISKIRNSPRIVLSAAQSKSELVQDELLVTDTNSDGFSDNYVVSDYFDGELDDGGQRIFADELAEAEEFLFTPETSTVSTDIVNIEKVTVDKVSGGNGRTPDMEIYGTTLVNLLGSYGNFETDTNADGLADGWVVDSTLDAPTTVLPGEQVLFGSETQRITLSPIGTCAIYTEVDVIEGRTYFISGYVFSGSSTTQLMEVGFDNDSYVSREQIGTSNVLAMVRKGAVVTAPAGATKMRLFLGFTSTTTSRSGWYDGWQIIDLTARGALDPIRAAKYGVANWEDLTEAQLEAEIPYFDSVMSVNVEDGTASELTVENRGKNLVSTNNLYDYDGESVAITTSYLLPYIKEYDCFLGVRYNLTYIVGGYVDLIEKLSNSIIVEISHSAYTVTYFSKCKPSTTYTLSTNWSSTTNYIHELDNSGNSITTHSFSQNISFTTSSNAQYLIIMYYPYSIGTFEISNPQLEEGSSATDYVPPREDSITIPDTCELHGYNGVFNYIDSNGNFVKNWKRDDKTTDVSGAFALTGYATGSKVICRNKTNGEVEVLDAAASVTTSWTEEDIEILYQLEIPLSSIETLTGAIKLYQGQNNVLSSDSSAPVAISVVNLNNDVTTSNNIVNIDNIINTASYEWNAGNLTSWSMSGRSFVNLLHDSEEVPDDYSRHFKSIDGNTYFDYLNATIITGDNTYTFVTNTSGDTASMAVYNLTELGNLTSLEADAANTLAEEVLYDTDTLWEDLPEAILTEMLPPYIAKYTKEYTTSYIKPITNTVEHHEIPIGLPLLGLKSYNNVINSDGSGTEYAKISDLSEGSFTYLGEVDGIDYVEIELDYDLSQDLEIPEIGVCWDYSSDVSTLTRRVIDTVVEVVWDYSSDVSTLSRRAIQ